MASPSPFGVYVHVPFCVSRCDYCAFATWTDRFHLVDDYVDACVTAAGRLLGSERPATSVFFGGGTPSLLDPPQIGRLLDAIPRAADAEVTVECNPETVDAAKLAGYRSAGVNRLSFGVQSMDELVLSGLGRRHQPASVIRAVEAAGQTGFAGRYSIDLIIGGAGETLPVWESTVRAVLALEPAPTHLSAYSLTIEPGTPLAASPDRHPDPDDQADKYLLVDALLSAAGLDWYEISNWARAGSECRHNQLYWTQGEYVGIGCAAHSHRYRSDGGARRSWNVRTPERYIKEIGAGSDGEAAGEDLDPVTRRREALELSLRTRSGVPESALPDWRSDQVLSRLVQPSEQAAPRAGVRLVLTPEGRLLANEVALRLVVAQPPPG